MKQIWTDTDFTLTGTSRPVRITVDGKEIFKGVLSAYPNEDEVNMLINKVCEPFLEMDYPANTGVTSHPKAYRIFRVEDWDGNLLGTQDFIYDWSYEAFRPVLSKPVNGKLDCRMRLPYTMWRSEAGDVDVHIGTDPWVDPDYCGGDCSWDMCADCFEDYDYDPYPDVYFEDTVYLNGLPKDYPITGSDGEQKYVWGIDSFIMDESGYTFSVYGSDIISGETNIDGSVLVLTIPYAQATSPNRYPPTGETAYVDFESASGMIKRHITAIVAYSFVRSGYSTESIYIEPVPFLSVDLDPENFNEYYIGKRTSYLDNGIHSAGFETNGSMYEGPYADNDRNIVQRQYVEFAQIHDVFHTEAAPYILSSITYSDEAVTVTMSSPFRLNCARILDYNSGKNYASSGARPGNEISAIKKIRFLDQLDGLLISKDGRYYGTSNYEIDIPISDRKFKSIACGYNGGLGNLYSHLFNFQTALSYKDEKYNFALPVLPDGEKTVVNTSNGVSIPWNSTPYPSCHQYPETGVTDFYVASFYTNQFIYEGGYAKIKQFNDVVKAANITYALDSQHLKAERVNAEEWLINDINEEDPTFVGDYGYLNVYNGETLAGHILYNNIGNNVSLYDCIQVETNSDHVAKLSDPSAHEDMMGASFRGRGSSSGNTVVVRWNTLLSDGVVLYNYPQRLNLNAYLYKSTHSNNISITCNGISSYSGITVTLRGVYDGFLITNNGDYGVTDIYFSGVTLDEFTNIAGLPSVYYNPTSDMDTLHVRGKWIRGKFGQRITLHNTEYPGQTSVWVPDEII